MAANELLLLHSPYSSSKHKRGGSEMSRRCVSYKSVRGKRGYVKRCARFSGGGAGFLGAISGGVPALGQSNTLQATFGDVKDVVMTAGIGAGGAIITQIVFDQLTKNIDALAGLAGYTRALAEAATGVAIGIIVGKFLKQPVLGAKLATGPVVLAALRIAGEMLQAGPFAAGGDLSDLGMMAVESYRPELEGAASQPQLGAMQVGPGTPSWMMSPEGEMAGVISGY